MYLFFDTETAALPRNYKAPATDTDNWPRIVQIAWLTCDSPCGPIVAEEHLIKPDGFKISAAATQVHGITTARAKKEGEELRPVLEAFALAVSQADTLVAHNLDFDLRVVQAEWNRAGMANVVRHQRQLCTMKSSADFCQLPGRYGYKWPSLTELYRELFQQSFAGAHGALADTQACRECYFRLQELGVVD